MRWVGLSHAKVEKSIFKNSLGDGIKTGFNANHMPVNNVTVEDSVFINNNRDGIDTTGGFNNSVISGSHFINLGVAGVDVKSAYEASDLVGIPINENLLIKDSEFVDIPNAVVITTNDRGVNPVLNDDNALTYAAQGITIKDSRVENTGDTYKKMLLVKDGYNIHWENIDLVGKLTESRVESYLDIGLSQDISGTNVTTGTTAGTEVDDNHYNGMAGPDWSGLSLPACCVPMPSEAPSNAGPNPISFVPFSEPSPSSKGKNSTQETEANLAPAANPEVEDALLNTTGAEYVSGTNVSYAFC